MLKRSSLQQQAEKRRPVARRAYRPVSPLTPAVHAATHSAPARHAFYAKASACREHANFEEAINRTPPRNVPPPW
jgi:hypothetical protein